MVLESRVKRDPEASRRRIVQAARAEFAQRGLDGARTSGIAHRAGVPSGLLYHYFENKEALLDAALDDALEPFYKAAVQLVSGSESKDPGELLTQAIRLQFAYMKDNPEVPALMAWWTASRRWEAKKRAKWTESSKKLRERGAALARQGQERGVIRPELDAESVVRLPFDLCLFWHQYWGWVAIERGIDGEDADAVEALHAERLEQIVDLVLGGVLTQEARKAWERRGPPSG